MMGCFDWEMIGLIVVLFGALLTIPIISYLYHKDSNTIGIVTSINGGIIYFADGNHISTNSGDISQVKVGQICTIQTRDYHLDYANCVPANVTVVVKD